MYILMKYKYNIPLYSQNTGYNHFHSQHEFQFRILWLSNLLFTLLPCCNCCQVKTTKKKCISLWSLCWKLNTINFRSKNSNRKQTIKFAYLCSMNNLPNFIYLTNSKIAIYKLTMRVIVCSILNGWS